MRWHTSTDRYINTDKRAARVETTVGDSVLRWESSISAQQSFQTRMCRPQWYPVKYLIFGHRPNSGRCFGWLLFRVVDSG